MKYLIDSNILIYHFNGDKTATNFLKDNLKDLAISIITYTEVLSFDLTDTQKEIIEDFLNEFKILGIDIVVAKQSIKNRKIKKIKLPDNFIASTAQINNLTLVTRNTKDFKNIDVKILNIYDESRKT
jgi:predicted nucleic acid-binding protein